MPLSLGPSCPSSLIGSDSGAAGSAFSAEVDAEPSEAILIRVVAASAGSDLLDAPIFFVSCRDGFRLCLGESDWAIDGEELFDAKFFATEMLSRATSVTGVAFDTLDIAGQAPGYQLLSRNYILVTNHSRPTRDKTYCATSPLQ